MFWNHYMNKISKTCMLLTERDRAQTLAALSVMPGSLGDSYIDQVSLYVI